MLVDDKRGVCIWDGRPEHDYAKVRWSDGSESGILPICRLRTEQAHFYEEVPENLILGRTFLVGRKCVNVEEKIEGVFFSGGGRRKDDGKMW